MTDTDMTFRPSVLFVMACTFVLGSVASAGFCEVLRLFGREAPAVFSYAFLWLLCILYLWSMGWAVAVSRALTVRISPEGVYGRSFWGRRARVSWQDVASVKTASLWPMRFWVVFPSNEGAPIWIPLFVKDKEKFRDAFLEWTKIHSIAF